MLLASCVSDSAPEEEPPPGNEVDPPSMNSPVPPDGVLEAVTWNIEWYGSFSNGPDDELQQTKNILQVADSLKADLYAFQEVSDQGSLDSLTKYMEGYRGFVSEQISYDQKLAFVYNTQTIDSLSAGAITANQDEYDWAGRLPLYFSFNYSSTDGSAPVEILAIVIHGKANTGDSTEQEEAYNRRVDAAGSLYTYLQNEHPDAHILLLGDYNDDVDVSIYDDSSPTPYAPFVENENSFRAVTATISEEGQSSYLPGNYTDLIDHIIMSDELFSSYVSSSEEIYFDAENFIENYESTTSDHLPVWAKFEFR